MKSLLLGLYVPATVAIVAFACGVVIGQEKVPRSNLAKYMVAFQPTELDREFLSLEIEDMQNSLNLLQEAVMPNQIGSESYYFNPKAGKIQVLVVVHGAWVETAPLKEVQDALKSDAQSIVSRLKFRMPEISDGDVEVLFTKITSKKNEIVNGFADYKNGALNIKR